MKNFCIITLLIFLNLNLTSQHDECAFSSSILDENTLNKTQIKSSESCNNPLRVHFYLLRDNDGNGGIYEELYNEGVVASEEDFVNQHIDLLNQAFAFSSYPDKVDEEIHSGNLYGEDIQFVSEGWDYYDSTFRLELLNPEPYVFLHLQSSNTAINVYLGSSGSLSTSFLPKSISSESGVVISRHSVLSNIVPHEIGHSLGLYHPYERVGRFHPGTGAYIGGENSEVFTLTSEFPFGENCANSSDGVCDTYPSAIFSSDDNCEFTSGTTVYSKLMPLSVGEAVNLDLIDSYDTFPFARVEENGAPYQFRQHDNFMGSGSSICKNKFTPGQSLRMHAFLDIVSSLSNANSDLSFVDVHSLQTISPSECGASDGTIEISVPKGVTVTAALLDDTLGVSVNGTLLLNNLESGIYKFLVEGPKACQIYYFEEILKHYDCPFDVDGNNIINISDLLLVTTNLGRVCCSADLNNDVVVNELDQEQLQTAIDANFCEDECPEDLNNDGNLDGEDADILISQFDISCACCLGDANLDGRVSSTDLISVASRLGESCDVEKQEFVQNSIRFEQIVSEFDMNLIMDAINSLDMSEHDRTEVVMLIKDNLIVSNEASFTMSIYPSPANDVLSISSDAPSLNLEIINVQGQIVHESSSTSPFLTLDVSHLPNGLYLMRDKENVVSEQKFIISR